MEQEIYELPLIIASDSVTYAITFVVKKLRFDMLVHVSDIIELTHWILTLLWLQ